MKRLISAFLFSFMIILTSFLSIVLITTPQEFGMINEQDKQIPSFSKDEIIKKVLNKEKVPFTNFDLANDFFEYKERNSEVIAMLAIDEVCYLPIMYSGDNSKYLNTNINNEYDIYGLPFVNALSKKPFQNITYIHGHNEVEGKRFGNLNKYLGSDFFNSNNPIEIFDGNYLYYLMPFSITKRNDGQEIIKQGDLPKNEQIEYISYKKNNSLINMSRIDLFDINNPVVFLSFCAGYDTIERYDLGLTVIQTVKYDGNVDDKE